MTDLCKCIFADHQRRNSQQEKRKFETLLRSRYPELETEEEKGLLGRSRNLVLGEPETAELILSAHYDTCTLLPFPNFILPDRPVLTYLLYVPMSLLLIVVCVGMSALLLWLTRSETAAFLGYNLPLVFFVFSVFSGKPSATTANDNTSGVISLLEIYEAMEVEQRRKTAFVFFDNEEKGLLGSRAFLRRYKRNLKDKLLVNLDCVSDGEEFFLVCRKNSMGEGERIALAGKGSGKVFTVRSCANTMYPSDQKGFPKSIAIASVHSCRIGHFLPRLHTKRDTVFDENNIEALKTALLQSIG